jgi:hypothetical protein
MSTGCTAKNSPVSFSRCQRPVILEEDNALYLTAREKAVANVRPIVSPEEEAQLNEYLIRLRKCLGADKRIGICNAGQAVKRTVLARDDSDYYYLVQTLNNAYLYDVQELLLRSSFAKPRKMIWAVNLASDAQAGLAIKLPSISLLRNGAGSLISAIVVN